MSLNCVTLHIVLHASPVSTRAAKTIIVSSNPFPPSVLFLSSRRHADHQLEHPNKFTVPYSDLWSRPTAITPLSRLAPGVHQHSMDSRSHRSLEAPMRAAAPSQRSLLLRPIDSGTEVCREQKAKRDGAIT